MVLKADLMVRFVPVMEDEQVIRVACSCARHSECAISTQGLQTNEAMRAWIEEQVRLMTL